ncbi:MAG TPA: DUF5000 domain-containing lipoprotein [Smithellaceae bacterium]|nr:DUF5000 domain-containing lipoprotein [Smithellaceae bacterium]
MPRTSPVLTNFTAGEWSPKLYGRIDLAQYQNACKAMRNFVVLVHGGAQRRPGTYFVAETKDSANGVDKKARLIPFKYDTTQAYVMEVGEGYARFYMDRGQIVDGSDNPIEIAFPFFEDDLFAFHYIQDKDLMYFFHPDYQPTKLTRTSHSAWQMTTVYFENGPFASEGAISDEGPELITNGDMEDDSNWTTIGSALLRERSNDRAYEGTYSQKVIAEAEDIGFKSDTFTTVTGTIYRLRFRVYTAAGSFKIKVHQGNDSGTWAVEETISDVPVNEWTEYTRYYTETAGGSGAYVEFLTALTANITGYDTDYPPEYNNSYVKATSYTGPGYEPYLATMHSTSLTGTQVGNSWETTTVTNRRFHIDLGEAAVIRRIYYENYHISGGYTDRGAKDFTLWGSNSPTAFAELTYATDTGWTELTCDDNQFDQHVGSNVADPKYINVTPTTKYRYYAIKIANNWGSGDCLGLRRIELQTAEYEVNPVIYIDKVEQCYVETNTITPSATTGFGITLTVANDFFTSGHIGALVEITHGETKGQARITAITSATIAVADVVVDFGGTTAATDWRISAWSNENGWPACGCFHEQRMIAGCTHTDPDGVWGSRTTAYEDFQDGSLATDSFAYKLQSDIVRWVASMSSLLVGTVDSEYIVGSINSDAALDSTDVKMTRKKRKGSANIDPINMGDSVLFVQRRGEPGNYGKKIREFTYNYDPETGVAGFLAYNLTLFAEHITGSGIVDWAFMSSPYPIIWAVTADGDLIGCSYEKEQKVVAFHKHPTDGDVESVCVIPGAEQDELWLIVKRTIDGVAHRFVEVMADFDFDTLDDAFFVDCGLTYDGAAATTISGLDHLEGEAVAVLADGEVVRGKTVSGGEITLDTAASKVHVGLPITDCYIQTVELEGGSIEGAAAGKQKKLHNVALRLYNTVGGKIGTTTGNLEDIRYPKGTSGLFTGITEDTCALGGWDNDIAPIIKQDDPLPMTILTIMPRYRTEDK